MIPANPREPIPNTLANQPDFSVPPALEAEIDELITHYPQKRSASLMPGSSERARPCGWGRSSRSK